MLVPFMSHATAWPVELLSQTRSALPSPLRSATSPIFHCDPLAPPTSTADVRDVPFISQIAACPEVFCHTMSEVPSPLKSPEPATDQVEPLALPTRAADEMDTPFIRNTAA